MWYGGKEKWWLHTVKFTLGNKGQYADDDENDDDGKYDSNGDNFQRVK